ncbi:GerAB/ArcD/ProY family transporter [Paenibacillus aceris]|uniref:Spore germination protein KB n=1 Tax=Paenibacillus aceris TaxID=869555 RepID=A0ABS4HWS2_9BACL|nr:endospore germination permease [Paenibacillus aceris]MBP1963073.1 spore germination protein KB [Paenibacillus aceris]NHW38806.1 endospore germination permease [Paenibacillus aceris]
MLKTEKISPFQIALIMHPVILATGFLALPTITAQYAKNDLWITGIIAFFPGMVSIYLAIGLHKLYPKMTISQYSEQIVGKWLGKLIGFGYFIYFMSSTGMILRQYAEFVSGNFLFSTPLAVIIGSILLLSAFAVRGGVEVIARCAAICTYLFILPLFILLFLAPDLDVKNIYPILSHGIVPVLKGSLTPQGWLAEFFIISYFLPSASHADKVKKWSILSLIVVVIGMTYVNMITLFLLGPDLANKIYPILIAVRYISLADFFENLESVLLAMWVLGNFVKITVFFYAGVVSYAHTFKITDYRPIVVPLAILAFLFSYWDIPYFTALANHNKLVAPFELFVVFIVIPLFLLLIAFIRKGRRGLSK